MKRILYLMVAILSMAATVGISAKDDNIKPTKVYCFGVSTSFNDSTVFFTEIQEIDNVWLESKSNFVVGRDNYSYQLRDHLSDKGYPKRTCIFVCHPTLKKVEKKYNKMKQRFVKKGGCDLLLIDKTEFVFKPYTPTLTDQEKLQRNSVKPKKPKGKKPEKGMKPPKGEPRK